MPPYSKVTVSLGDSSSCAQLNVFTATSLKVKARKKVPAVSPPELLRRPRPTCLNDLPEQALEKKMFDETSIFRVIENGLKVIRPAPAPELWLPMFSVCSTSKL